MTLAARPKALTIAGSDSSGGAGIQADLKTFAALGAYGMSVVAALTAQNTLGVQAIHNAPPEFVRAQIRAVLSDVGADAIKTGMLSTADIIDAVVESLKEARCRAPIVVDPVFAAKSGDRLLREDALEALVAHLLPMAEVLTPNAAEAAALAGFAVRSEADAERAAAAILDLGPQAVLLKGGHLDEAACDDLFADRSGRRVWLRGERLAQRHTHGTGCTLAAAIAVGLARGLDALEACRRAKRFLAGAIRHARPIGGGIGPVNHLWRLEDAIEAFWEEGD
ncbi:MAG: bifunctional hydroxymethylpyrimidine kinase/phosphomethylpyrimidine kinase [Candidatus Sumerlaeota bacterium]|nr:bifunctional hydroxymethylpyrimidine kinase/phosphomethylpyrimidine kinase [Candidatus Sumerlaeota bacterium]